MPPNRADPRTDGWRLKFPPDVIPALLRFSMTIMSWERLRLGRARRRPAASARAGFNPIAAEKPLPQNIPNVCNPDRDAEQGLSGRQVKLTMGADALIPLEDFDMLLLH